MYAPACLPACCHQEKGEDVMEGEGEEAGDKLIRVTYHGIVNTESDVTAEKFGINLKSE